jgi:hypothetical protein
MTQTNGNGSRPASHPAVSTATGTIAGSIGSVVALAVAANNPDLAAYAPVIGGAASGVLNGVGNASRNYLASGKGGLGWLLASLFSWLG